VKNQTGLTILEDYTPVIPTDDVIETPILEVLYEGMWVVTDPDIFRSWTGLRRRNGEKYHGEVYNMGTDILYEGARVCPCSVCQGHVKPTLRYN